MFLSDERFSHIGSVNEYIDRIFERKASPVIRVQSVATLRRDIGVFDRVSISNWEKNLPDNMVVNGLTYLRTGAVVLDIGTPMRREEELVL